MPISARQGWDENRGVQNHHVKYGCGYTICEPVLAVLKARSEAELGHIYSILTRKM
jgi:hypothetical protein